MPVSQSGPSALPLVVPFWSDVIGEGGGEVTVGTNFL